MSPRINPRTSRTTHVRWVAGLALLGFAATSCAAAINERHPGQEELKVSSTAPLGRIVADDEGRTMYMFDKDESGESYCHGACESVWPPVTTKAIPKIEDGISAGKVSLLKRENGLMQVVYNGHPLYYYQGDTGRAQTHGQEQNQFGAEWYALTASGNQAHGGNSHYNPNSPTSSYNTGGGYG